MIDGLSFLMLFETINNNKKYFELNLAFSHLFFWFVSTRLLLMENKVDKGLIRAVVSMYHCINKRDCSCKIEWPCINKTDSLHCWGENISQFSSFWCKTLTTNCRLVNQSLSQMQDIYDSHNHINRRNHLLKLYVTCRCPKMQLSCVCGHDQNSFSRF